MKYVSNAGLIFDLRLGVLTVASNGQSVLGDAKLRQEHIPYRDSKQDRNCNRTVRGNACGNFYAAIIARAVTHSHST